MKSRITTPANMILTLFVLLFACKKDPVITPMPLPGKDSTPSKLEKALLQFNTTTNLSGQPYHSSNLHAVVTIINEKNVEVIKDSILVLNLDGSVTTQAIELPVGTYRLTDFRLEYGYVQTHFAAPKAASAKAPLVQKPLALEFKVEKGNTNLVPVEVLKVAEGEKPGSYGYPSGAFDHGQSDANPFMKIKLRAIMKIGEVVYDSIPASLRITTWNSNGEMNTTYAPLKAGTNEIQLIKSAVKYELQVSKWGTNDAITLDRQNVDENTVYTLGGNKEAKKLKSEILYKQVNGADVAESKTNYSYDGAGKLLKIEYWLKKADRTPYLSMTDRFEYNGERVEKISRYDEVNKGLMRATTFSYDNQGKVLAISESENGAHTSARIQYTYYEHPEMVVNYDLPGDNDLDYYTDFSGGNTVSSSARTTNGHTETGRYGYDFNINPYKHMNWPDLYLSHNSKNNMTSQQKTYSGAYPVSIPYSFNYTYDADGYPKEVIKQYKSYTTGNFIFSTKTIFVY